jgi:hypothetical protein
LKQVVGTGLAGAKIIVQAQPGAYANTRVFEVSVAVTEWHIILRALRSAAIGDGGGGERKMIVAEPEL